MKKIKNLYNILAKLGLEREARLVLASADTNENNINEALETLKPIFNGSIFDKSVIPTKISQIPENLTSFASEKGRGDVSFSSNGILRDLKETIMGGPARDPGSYHGLGLAHDLIIKTPKNNNSYNGIGENKNIIQKDPGLVDIMNEYAEKNQLKWGGHFRRGDSYNLPSGLTVYDMELHHFEIPTEQLIDNVDDRILSALDLLDISEEYLKNSNGRELIYRSFISLFEDKDKFSKSFSQNKESLPEFQDSELSEYDDSYKKDDLDSESSIAFIKAIFS